MLDAFIIEQIRRREEQENNRAQHENRLQLPLPISYHEPDHVPVQRPGDDGREAPQKSDRGVVVVDL